MTATSGRAAALAAEGVPFVEATVVRAQRPTSVRPGDTALVLLDGTIDGFVGGTCAEESVRLYSARVLRSGEPLLLRILPGEAGEPGEPARADGAAEEGAVTVANPCLSGGGLEVFLQPRLPAPRVLVTGDTPVARALVALGAPLGYEVVAVETPTWSDRDLALVVASHGRDETDVLTAALHAGVPYVGLVASKRRGAAVAAALDVTDEQRARMRTPAGLALGARAPEEVALAILAEVVATRRAVTPPSEQVATVEAAGTAGCH